MWHTMDGWLCCTSVDESISRGAAEGVHATTETQADSQRPGAPTVEAQRATENAPVTVVPSRSYQLVLEASVGVDFDECDDYVCIISVHCEEFECKLRHADRIKSVDGDTTLEGMLNRLKEGGQCTLEVVRPQELLFTLRKTPQMSKIGAIIGHSAKQSLLIKAIKEGLFEEHNRLNPDHRVRPGDRIIEINGIRHNSELMLGEISHSDTIKVAISCGTIDGNCG
jgi:hypothetical protein